MIDSDYICDYELKIIRIYVVMFPHIFKISKDCKLYCTRAKH